MQHSEETPQVHSIQVTNHIANNLNSKPPRQTKVLGGCFLLIHYPSNEKTILGKSNNPLGFILVHRSRILHQLPRILRPNKQPRRNHMGCEKPA